MAAGEAAGGSEKATLNQILAKKDVDEESAVAKLDRVDPFVKFPSAVHAEGWLSADDISHLARFINPEYLVQGSVERIAEKFVDESHIQLYKFLNDDLVGHISRYIKERTRRRDVQIRDPEVHLGHRRLVDDAWPDT